VVGYEGTSANLISIKKNMSMAVTITVPTSMSFILCFLLKGDALASVGLPAISISPEVRKGSRVIFICEGCKGGSGGSFIGRF
jgi:hypothetical protein